MSHTPGPWTATKAGPVMQGYMQGDAVASIEYSTLVAGCFSDVRGGPEVAEQNARLIAAAPDLLAALRAYVEHAESDIEPGKPDSPFQQRLQAGRAAIAKATGAARNAS